MVRYTLPAAILTMAIGAMASDTTALQNNGPVLSSDGAIKGRQQIISEGLKHIGNGLTQKGRGGKSGKGKGGGSGRNSGTSGRNSGTSGRNSGSSSTAASFSAVYTMTNQPNNEVLVYSRNESTGALTFEDAVSTGGSGGAAGINSGPPHDIGVPPESDPLGSSNSLFVTGRCLLAVNAGSNHLSSFRINSASDLQFVDKVGTKGTWPNSVASNGDGLVYVLNSGGNGSIQGYNLDDTCGLTFVGSPHELPQGGGPIDANNASPSDPPTNYASPKQVEFTPTGDLAVLVASLGGGQNGSFSEPDSIAAVYVFQVEADGTVAYPVETRVEGRRATFPFAFTHDAQGRFLMVEIQIQGHKAETALLGGVSVWEHGMNGGLTELQVLETESLTCWIKYNPSNGCSYAANTGNGGSISTLFSGNDGVSVAELIAASPTTPIDVAVSGDGNNLYVLNPSPDDGVPQLYAYSTNTNCKLAEVQVTTDGLATRADRVAADGAANGIVGLATFPAAV